MSSLPAHGLCSSSQVGQHPPLDDAVQFNHLEVVKLLQDYQDSYTPSETWAEAAAEALSKENLESMV